MSTTAVRTSTTSSRRMTPTTTKPTASTAPKAAPAKAKLNGSAKATATENKPLALIHRDHTKYRMDHEVFNKGKLVLAVIKKFVANVKPKSVTELQKAFPKELQGSFNVIERIQVVKANQKNMRRYFVNDDQVIKIGRNTLVVNREWSTKNIEKVIKKAREFDMNISKVAA